MENGTTLAEHLAQLREENEYLRRAAETFGALAERLMRELEAERRRAAKREAVGHRPRHRLQQPVG